MNNVQSVILIWNEETKFIRIAEGTGDNLFQEDIEDGYVDYVMIDNYEYDNDELVETYIIDGGQMMLTELYQEQFHNAKEVVDYTIKAGFIPDVDYIILN